MNSHFLIAIKGSARLLKLYADASVESEAEEIMEKYSDQDFSYADAVSFVVMKDREIKEAFTFDQHFLAVGFELLPEG